MTDERISDERLDELLSFGETASIFERTELVRAYRAHLTQASEIAALRAENARLQSVGSNHSHKCRKCSLHYSPAADEGEDCPCCGFDGVGPAPLLTGNPAPAQEAT